MHWLKYTQMEYQINMLVYLVALVTNSLIHQTHHGPTALTMASEKLW